MMGAVIRSCSSICWLVYARGQNVVLLKQIDHPSRDTVIHRIKLSSYILVPRGQFTDNSLSSAGLQDRGLICYGTFRDLIKNLAGTI